jgi:hypothetical protein
MGFIRFLSLSLSRAQLACRAAARENDKCPVAARRTVGVAVRLGTGGRARCASDGGRRAHGRARSHAGRCWTNSAVSYSHTRSPINVRLHAGTSCSRAPGGGARSVFVSGGTRSPLAVNSLAATPSLTPRSLSWAKRRPRLCAILCRALCTRRDPIVARVDGRGARRGPAVGVPRDEREAGAWYRGLDERRRRRTAA